MVSTLSLSQLEEMIEQLSRQERLLLIERLAHRLREEVNGTDRRSLMTEPQTVALPQEDLPETPAERGARLLEQSLREQPEITAAWDKVVKEMGIGAEPIAAEDLQKMFLDCGINPEDNEFSRGIIEMREE